MTLNNSDLFLVARSNTNYKYTFSALLSDIVAELGSSFGEFPVGTVMLFYQGSAPPGWVQLTRSNGSQPNNDFNNTALRLVTNTSGGTFSSGGQKFTTFHSNNFQVNISGDTDDSTQSNEFNTSADDVNFTSVNAHTMSIAQMPLHDHPISQAEHNHSYDRVQDETRDVNSGSGGATPYRQVQTIGTGTQNAFITIGSNGGDPAQGGAAHTHGIPDQNEHSHTYRMQAHSHPLNIDSGNDFQIQYVNVIIAQKQ